MVKKVDYIILSVICLFLGIFIISQYYSSSEYKKVTEPENNAVLALEVSKLTKSNADLRREVQDLTNNLETYKGSTESTKKSYDQYLMDSERLDVINGVKPKSGQGIVIQISGKLNTAQVVDLVNALKNIGTEVISINNERLVLNTNLDKFNGMNNYEFKAIGNSSLLKSAIERRGGIIDQIASKDIKFNVISSEKVEIFSGDPLKLNYSRIIK